jgi:hypothetical protein
MKATAKIPRMRRSKAVRKASMRDWLLLAFSIAPSESHSSRDEAESAVPPEEIAVDKDGVDGS